MRSSVVVDERVDERKLESIVITELRLYRLSLTSDGEALMLVETRKLSINRLRNLRRPLFQLHMIVVRPIIYHNFQFRIISNDKSRIFLRVERGAGEFIQLPRLSSNVWWKFLGFGESQKRFWTKLRCSFATVKNRNFFVRNWNEKQQRQTFRETLGHPIRRRH